jgi:hypothetical protein
VSLLECATAATDSVATSRFAPSPPIAILRDFPDQVLSEILQQASSDCGFGRGGGGGGGERYPTKRSAGSSGQPWARTTSRL